MNMCEIYEWEVAPVVPDRVKMPCSCMTTASVRKDVKMKKREIVNI